MSGERTFTFFTYSSVSKSDKPRWFDDGIGNEFFDSEELTRQAIIELLAELARDAENPLQPMRLEKIETRPITKESLLALLNEGVGAIVERHEIVATIEGGR